VLLTRSAPRRAEGKHAAVPGEFFAVQMMPGETRSEVEQLFLPTKRRTSVEVHCATIEDGLRRAAEVLDHPVDDLSHKVVREKVDGVLGFGAKPYILRVEVAPKKAPGKTAKPVSARNGMFRLEDLPQGVHLTVIKPIGSGTTIELDEVLQEIQNKKIARPIDEALVAKTVQEAAGAPVRIDVRAEAKPAADKKAEEPEPLEAAQAAYAYGREPAELSAKEARALFAGYAFGDVKVHAGQLLAARLQGAPAEVPVIAAGTNMLSLDDGQRLFAMYDGVVHWCGDEVWMAPLREMTGVAAGATIAYDGSLAINGSVGDGATVTVAGSLLVAGNVGAATLVAGGTIIVQHAVIGGDQACLQAGGDLYVRYAERATCEVGASVLVDEALLHCQVHAGSRIIGCGAKTMLLGGELRAGEEIDAAEIGSPLGEKMRVCIGAAATDRQIVGGRKKQLEELRDRLQVIDKELAAAPPEKSMALTVEKQRQQALVREQEYQLQEIEARIKDDRSGRLAVATVLQPGVTLVVGTAPPQDVAKEMRRCSIMERRGRIANEAYKEAMYQRCRRVRPVALPAAALTVPADPLALISQLADLRRMMRLRAAAETVAVKQAARFLGLPPAALAALSPPDEGKEKKKPAKGETADTEYFVAQLTPGDTLDSVREAYFPAPRKIEVEVICESIETGLARGAAALKLTPDEVTHRVLEEAKTGMLGVGARPWRIAISPKSKETQKSFPFKTPALDALLAACRGTFTVVAQDGELQVTVHPPKGQGKPVEVAEIKRQLEQQGYRKGIDAKQLETIVRNASGQPVAILKLSAEPAAAENPVSGEAPAAAAPPELPRDGTGTQLYSWPWEREREMTAKEMKTALLTADLSDIAVHAGQLLAASLAQDQGQDVLFEPGANVLMAAEGRRLYAAVDGLVQWSGNQVAVSPIRRIEGNATARQGNIVTPGSIIVSGDVEDGLTLQADGCIIVLGTVGRAQLSANGSVTVKKGILGGGQGAVRAGADVYAGFIENARIDAADNVIVDEAILHSTVQAGAKIVCVGDKGVIVGGNVQAGEEVNCRDLGSPAGAETVVVVGARIGDKTVLEQVRRDVMLAREQLETLGKHIGGLVTRKASGKLDAGEQEQLDRQLSSRKRIESLLERLQAQEKRMAAAIESPVNGVINVAGIAYAGSKLVVGRSDPTVLNKEEKRPSFVEKGGMVSVEVYREPKVRRRNTLPALAAAETTATIDAAEHEARLARIRKCQQLLAPDEKSARQRAALFTGLNEEALAVFVVPQPEPVPAGAPPKKSTTAEKPPAGLRPWLAVQVVPGENLAALERKYLPVARRTSVEVTCAEIAEGVRQGAAALGLPVEQVQHKVIQEKSKGLFGVGHKPYILQVSVRAKKEHAGGSAAEAIAQFNRKEDGHFVLVNADDGLRLTVHAPKGDGLRAEPDKVKKELEKRGYRNGVDLRLLTETVRTGAGVEVIIGPRQPEPELDGRIDITVAPDRMRCEVIVTAHKPMGRPTTVEELVQRLTEEGIKRPDFATVQRIYRDGLFDQPVVVAEGVPVVPGQHGRYEFMVELNKEVRHLDEDERGKVDFKELNIVENVTAGQVVAKVHPPVPGRPGVDVFDREIGAKPVKENQLVLGRNVALSPDGKEVVATADGQIMLIGRLLRVEPVYMVGGDVNFETGNISFLGSVIVKGTVCQGFTVRAAGNIIAGSVDKANLDAEGDITVLGGIIGDAASMLRAGQDLRAKFVEGARLVAGRDIIVQESIMHSDSAAGRAILCTAGKKGVLVGGTIRAGHAVAAKEIGTAVATKTVLEVGLDPLVRLQITDLEKTLVEYAEHFKKVRLGMKVLLEVRQKTGTLPPPKEALLQQLQAAAGNMQQRVNKAEQQLRGLQEKVAEKRDGRVSAAQFVHPGCRITIRNATLNIEQPLSRTCLVYEQGEVRMAEFAEIRYNDNADD